MISLFRKLKWLTQRRSKEAELRAELQFHLDEETEARRGEGRAMEPARWAARRDLGNVALIQEDTRAMWGWTTLGQVGQDARYAVRTMANTKVFSALAVLSLALGIGGNAAMFSVVSAVLIRPLPYPEPARLVRATNDGYYPPGGLVALQQQSRTCLLYTSRCV